MYVNSTEAVGAGAGAASFATCADVVAAAHDYERQACGLDEELQWTTTAPHRTAPHRSMGRAWSDA